MTGPNHPLHLILTIITCGFWILPWLFIASSNRRRYQTVDPDGTVRTLRSSRAPLSVGWLLVSGVAIALLLVVGQGHVGGVVAFVGGRRAVRVRNPLCRATTVRRGRQSGVDVSVDVDGQPVEVGAELGAGHRHILINVGSSAVRLDVGTAIEVAAEILNLCRDVSAVAAS